VLAAPPPSLWGNWLSWPGRSQHDVPLLGSTSSTPIENNSRHIGGQTPYVQEAPWCVGVDWDTNIAGTCQHGAGQDGDTHVSSTLQVDQLGTQEEQARGRRQTLSAEHRRDEARRLKTHRTGACGQRDLGYDEGKIAPRSLRVGTASSQTVWGASKVRHEWGAGSTTWQRGRY
jgi:hypothetical protein